MSSWGTKALETLAHLGHGGNHLTVYQLLRGVADSKGLLGGSDGYVGVAGEDSFLK